jgi:hypothetical protein
VTRPSADPSWSAISSKEGANHLIPPRQPYCMSNTSLASIHAAKSSCSLRSPNVLRDFLR